MILTAVLHVSSAPIAFDLNATILQRCGDPGSAVDGGCRIRLPAGTLAISQTIQIGDCTTETSRTGVIIEGVSAGKVNQQPRFPSAGTTLQWAGPAGGVLFDVCGSSFISLRDVVLDAKNARYAIRLSANNSAGAVSHFNELRGVTIDGPDTGIYVTGVNYADQVDFLRLDHVSIRNVGIGYVQDSQQSAMNHLESVEVAARKRGFVIRSGPFYCDGCYVGSRPPLLGEGWIEFIGFYLRAGTNPSNPGDTHHQVHIEHSHMELDRGRFVVADANSNFPITLIGNSYSLQCALEGCEMMIADVVNNAPLVMIGDVINASSNPPVSPSARVCYRGPELIHLGVQKTPSVAQLTWSCAG